MDTTTNPLLQPPALPLEALPLHLCRTEHYLPAVEAGIASARAAYQAVREATDAPTFENTILAMEEAEEPLDVATGIYFALLGAEGTDDMHKLSQEISPKLAAFANEVSLDEKLFARVDALRADTALPLTTEQRRLLDKTWSGFVRNGARLDESGKQRLRDIDRELSGLSPKFQQVILEATRTFELWIDKAADLTGLPDDLVESTRKKAAERGGKGELCLTLDGPTYMGVLRTCDQADVREQLWRGFASRGNTEAHDTKALLRDIVRLRIERARLLGYPTHAAYVLERRMAGTQERVRGFLDEMHGKTFAAAKRDLEDLRACKRSLGDDTPFMPWDILYLQEKLRQQRFDYDNEALRPYFPLPRVVDGMFEHARRLFGLEFRLRTDIPAYHSECEVYEVTEPAAGNRFIGLLYIDLFPRPAKRSGAWVTTFKGQGWWAGAVRRPHVHIVCNFTRPGDGKPALLAFDEVRTLFHEFGHALHNLLSDCTYRSVAGTSVFWDFVELPSQIMENWILESESLALLSAHVDTGAPLPADLVAKVRDSARFMAGWNASRQLSLGFLDMAWHTLTALPDTPVEEFELAAVKHMRLLDPVPGMSTSTSFLHIFSGGYSAGYYSYKWAEVLEADAFGRFQEEGIFNPATARAFRDNILSKGDTEDPMELFIRFRGRPPSLDALLRRDGLA